MLEPLSFKSSSTTSRKLISMHSLLCSLLNVPISLQVSPVLFMETCFPRRISTWHTLRLATRAKRHNLSCLQQRQDSLHGSISRGCTSLLLSVQEGSQVVVVAEDGLMALIVPGVPDGFLDSQASTGSEFALLGSCLMDMAKEGRIKEEEVDSFNLPIYYTTPKELEDIIRSNGELKFEKMDTGGYVRTRHHA